LRRQEGFIGGFLLPGQGFKKGKIMSDSSMKNHKILSISVGKQMRKQSFMAIRNILLLVFFITCLTNSLLFAKNDKKPSTIQAQFDKLKAEGKQRVIVKFKDEIDPSVVKKYGRFKKNLKIINAAIAEIDIDKIELLKAEPVVENVIPDVIFRLPRITRSTDTAASQMQTITQTESTYPDPWTDWNLQYKGINATGAWEKYPGLDGSGVTIAIIDSGVNYTLEDLNEPYYLGGWDFINDDSEPLDDMEPYGHGTEVASILLAQGEEKIKGVAPHASYYSLKVISEQGYAYMGEVINAIDWAVDPDGDPDTDDAVDIISMSLGIRDPYSMITLYLTQACNAAYNAGVVLVAGSGNDALATSLEPAAYTNVISVGGHNIGQELYTNSSGGVDLIAPGEWVWAMDMIGEVTNPENGLRWRYYGTSCATPHVAGLAALIIQHARDNNIEVNNGYVWECIKHSAVDLPLITDPIYEGKGKAWAAESLSIADPNDGAIDLLDNNWPIDFSIDFTAPKYERNMTPAYYIDDTMTQDVNVINITDIFGGYADDITNLTMTTHQNYYQREGDNFLPGDPNEIFSSLSVNAGDETGLSDSYYIPTETVSGLNQTTVEFDFQFSGNNRQMHIAYNELNFLWLAVDELTADFEPDGDVDFVDFSVLSEQWQQSGSLIADIAPEPVDGIVNLLDMVEFVSQWMEDAVP
jgi:subtilisin family serine protease